MEKAFSVEFLGLPGSGKTSIVNALKAKLVVQQREVVSHRDMFDNHACQALGVSKLLRNLFELEDSLELRIKPFHVLFRNKLFEAFREQHPAYVAACEGLIQKSTFDPKFKTTLVRWLKNEGASWAIYQRLKEVRPLVLLNDEGFIHRASIYFADANNVSAQVMKEYFDLAPKHDMIGILKIRPEEALARRPGANPCFQLTNVEDESAKRKMMDRFALPIDRFLLWENISVNKQLRVELSSGDSLDENVSKIWASIIEMKSST
jgi:hypothetical protein